MMIFALAMLASVPLSSVSIQCNAVDADGIAKPYSLEIVTGENPTVTMSEVGRFSAIPLRISNVVVGPTGNVRFTAHTGRDDLDVELWDGFSRKFSQIDGKYAGHTTKGLTFLTGICTDGTNFTPVSHKFDEERYPIVGKEKLQRCFGVTLDGRKFSSILNTVSETVAEFSTNGLGQGNDFDKASLTIGGFPALPQTPGFQTYWASFRGKDGERKPSIISEAYINVNAKQGSQVLDFQTLGDSEWPLMVARAHCGLFPVHFGSAE